MIANNLSLLVLDGMACQQDGDLLAVLLLKFHLHVFDIAISFYPLLEGLTIFRVHIEILSDIDVEKFFFSRIIQHFEEGLVTV